MTKEEIEETIKENANLYQYVGDLEEKLTLYRLLIEEYQRKISSLVERYERKIIQKGKWANMGGV